MVEREEFEDMMKSNLRRLINTGMVLVMLMSMTIMAAAGEGDIYSAYLTDDDSIMLISDLYDKSNVYSNKGTFTTGDITAVSGDGNIIRVWFKNEGTQGVQVKLIKSTMLGLSEKTVVSFSVPAGSNVYKEYEADGADSGKYRVKLIADSGSKIKGYLRVRQLEN